MNSNSLNITVVEDDKALRALIVSVLRKEGHQVSGLESAESIDDEGGTRLIDLLITDLNLPGESGLSLARRFRDAQPEAGVMMVTALDQVQDKVSGYEHGADIYLTKPIEPSELLAAVRSFSRRLFECKLERNSDSTLILKPDHLNLKGKNSTVSISHDEALILAGLARAPGHILEYWQLLEILEIDAPYSKSALEVRIVRLRKKITEAGHEAPSIKSVRGKGYQLSLPISIS
ncbi:MAG: response regulator transcription factor [Gammaproteobacteria bacterium]|nr:response regulator transcription factor [Gammaproteobacteria bacterium]